MEDVRSLASFIDQTLLTPTVGFDEGRSWIEASSTLGFAALCVPPFLVSYAADVLEGSSTKVCSVVGFPLGHDTTESKAASARALVEAGCTEIDAVLNIGALLEGSDTYVREEVRAVVRAVAHASDGEALVKVILETGYLTVEQIARASRLAVAAGARYVKTSTGFGPRGASVEDVSTMRGAVGPDVGVKASGGIRDLEAALVMRRAGADRLGTSAGIEIVRACDGDGRVR